MSRRAVLSIAALLLGGLLAAGTAAGLRGERVVVVAPGQSVAGAAAANPGATIELAAGTHAGFTLEAAATVRGHPEAVVSGEIAVLGADGTHLSDLDVRGAGNGITVRGADDVVLHRVRVHMATDHGIELVQSSATVSQCLVDGLRADHAQGIEVRNSNGHPTTVVEGCHVHGGIEGIVSHVSRVIVRDNVVAGQSMRGISITEMSEGLVEGNDVEGVTGVGVFCGDMSHCEIHANRIRDVAADNRRIRSRSGQGVVGWYYSTLRVHDNTFDRLAGQPVDVYHGSVRTDRFPLAVWWHGWRGTVGGWAHTMAFLLVLVGLRLVTGAALPRWDRRHPPRPGRPPRDRPGLTWRDGAFLVAAVYVVQSFHMVEHVVQVFQTYVASAEDRSGLLGMHADTEWVHFLYNLGVLVFLVLLWRAVRTGRTPLAPGGSGTATLAATLLLQGYHMAEHVAKLSQHVALRIDPGPGIIGARFGLVWFHFAINLAVHAGLTVVLWRMWRARRTFTRPQAPWRPSPPTKREAPSAVSPDRITPSPPANSPVSAASRSSPH